MVDLFSQHIKILDEGDEAARRQTINFLTSYPMENWDAVPPGIVHALVEGLRRQLLDGIKQTFLRQRIVIILGNIGPRSQAAIPPLLDLLGTEIPDSIREEAVMALTKIGCKNDQVVDQLVNLLPHCRTALALRVIDALSGMVNADRKIGRALLNRWETVDQSQHSQVQVALALCKLKVEAPGLLFFLTRAVVVNQDTGLRTAAAQALGWCNKDEIDVVPALLTAALGDKDEKVRNQADAALAQLKLSHENAVALCAEQLNQSLYAEGALRKSGQLAVPFLIDLLRTKTAVVRQKVAQILGSLGELAEPAVAALTVALRDKNFHSRLAIAKSLWNISKNAESVVPVLMDLLQDKEIIFETADARRQFLQTVIEALGRIGPSAQAAVPVLKEMARDKNRLVSESAVRALTIISPKMANIQGSR